MLDITHCKFNFLSDSLLHNHITSTFHFTAMQNYKSQHAALTLQKLKIYNFKCQEFTAFFSVANFEFKTVSILVQLYYCFWMPLKSAHCFKVNY